MPSASEIGKSVLRLTPVVAPLVAGGTLRKLLEVALEGYGKVPGARKAASKALDKSKDHESAIRSLVRQHVSMAGGQGFVTNLGGLLTAIVAVPANMAGSAVIQCRMVGAIAHLRGYDLDDNRVRSAVLMCLLGEKRTKELIKAGDLPSTPLGVATAPVFDPDLDLKISQFVMSDIMAFVTGKRLGVIVSKRVPVVGGGVGLAVDGWSTIGIASHAKKQFPSRRPK